MITLITPTCDRPEAFALCERWMGRQSMRWDEWIVLDDGTEPVRCTMGQRVRRTPQTRGLRSLAAKLELACGSDDIRGEVIVIIEDDDWYSPEHIGSCVSLLELSGAELVGEARALYYHVGRRCWTQHGNTTHASLCQTAMRRGMLGTLRRVACACPDGFVDFRLWSSPCRRYMADPEQFGGERTCVGIKGLPGLSGYGMGHRPDSRNWRGDPDLSKLRSLIGDDAACYERYHERRP